MYYLSACNRDLLKSKYCYVLFLPFEKSFRCSEKKTNSISLIPSLKKIFLVSKYKKQTCYTENKSLFF